MNHYQLYESWLFQDKTIYEVLGQYFENFLVDYQRHIVKNDQVNLKIFKALEKKDIKEIDFFKFIDVLFEQFEKNIKNPDLALDSSFQALYYQLTLSLIYLRIDVKKLLKNRKIGTENILILELKESFLKQDRYLKTLFTNSTKFEKAEDKIREISKLVNKEKSWWISLSKQPNQFFKFKVLKHVTLKADVQAQEDETKIINNLDSNNITYSDKLISQINDLNDITGFSKKFLSRFDQPGLEGSHKFMNKEFLNIFSKAEKLYGKELKINSGYRTEEYQQELKRKGYKTAKKSPHVQGMAADVSIVGEDVERLIQAFSEAGITRRGLGKTFLHVDSADRLNPKIWVPYAQWTYKY